jgi:single-strand DNA-binding protein
LFQLCIGEVINEKINTSKTIIMNALRNKVQLIGFTGNVPEIKTMESGKKLAKFSIATNEVYYNTKGEKVTETQWHNIIAWDKQAELVEKFVDKGTEVVLEGKLLNKSYEDKNGVKKYITEIQAHELVLVGSKK